MASEKLVELFGLDNNTHTVYEKQTELDGEKLPIDTRPSLENLSNLLKELAAKNKYAFAYANGAVTGDVVSEGSGFYKNGITIVVLGKNVYEFYSWTVNDGRHVLNFCCLVNGEGRLLSVGLLNVFGLGVYPLVEQEYVDNFFCEIMSRNGKIVWDSVL